MFRILRQTTRILAVAAVAILLLLPQLAAALPYGEGSYGTCSYEDCAPPATPIVTTLPGGLEISINLADGQTIPHDGYTITVTPLNGQGTSFDHVDFYINGKLVQTSTPDNTGSVSWFWDPREYKGTKVKIVVTGTDGSTATEEVTVKIGAKPVTTPGAVKTETPPKSTSLPARLIESGENLIRKLPPQVVPVFPYILFIGLAVILLLLFDQARRELKEYRAARSTLERQRLLEQSKENFLGLVSHYLRTPLTVLLGGIETLQTVDPARKDAMRATGKRMHDTIELLIAQINSITKPIDDLASNPNIKVHFWRRPGLWGPIVAAGLVTLMFNYLAVHAGALKNNQVNFIFQGIVFAGLATLIYQTFRNTYIKQGATVRFNQLAAAEAANNQARDEVITGTTTGLRGDLASLKQAVASLGTGQAVDFIAKGVGRFDTLMDKFDTALQIRGDHSNLASTNVQISDLLAQAHTQVDAEAAQRGIAINTVGDTTTAVSNPKLLSLVLATLVDNAVVHSPDKTPVTITTANDASGSTITVTDQGDGIDAEKLGLIFQPFSRVEDLERFDHEGMGFSLYLDKLIMQYLGGAINMTSQPGQNTTVTLHLPAATA